MFQELKPLGGNEITKPEPSGMRFVARKPRQELSKVPSNNEKQALTGCQICLDFELPSLQDYEESISIIQKPLPYCCRAARMDSGFRLSVSGLFPLLFFSSVHALKFRAASSQGPTSSFSVDVRELTSKLANCLAFRKELCTSWWTKESPEEGERQL